jgi:hypothetical protein
MPKTVDELENCSWNDFLIVESNSFDGLPSRSTSTESPDIDPVNWFPKFLNESPIEPVTPITMPAEIIKFPVYYNEIENRTILVSNIHPDTTPDEFFALMQRFGETQTVDVDNLHSGRASVTFYNLWSAHEFRAWGAGGSKVGDRVWMVRFAPPKEPKDNGKVENCGTIVIFGLNPGTSIDQLSLAFGQFGNIREIRRSPGNDRNAFIEFWDLRSAERAVIGTNHKKISALGVRISTEFSIPGGFRKIAPKVLKDVVPSIERRDRKSSILSFGKRGL